MKKIERAAIFVEQHLALFKCPVCGGPFVSVKDNSIVCQKKHSFDLSRKGTLFMITHKVASEYDSGPMWKARKKMLFLGMFDPIIAAITKQLPYGKKQTILDVGAGEGTPAAKIKAARSDVNDTVMGVDISKTAVSLATDHPNRNFYCVADLAALPLAKNSFDVLTDIFSPAAYSEFKRVLKPGGTIYKVIPNSEYLKELRALMYSEESNHRTYENSYVLALFAQNFPDFSTQKIKYIFTFPVEDFKSLILMTPLSWGASPELKNHLLDHPLSQITVDVTLLTAVNS